MFWVIVIITIVAVIVCAILGGAGFFGHTHYDQHRPSLISRIIDWMN